MARIVLNTFGSFGDLHPFLAVSIGLKQRGHEVTIAAAEVYREKVIAEGVGFAPVRPDIGQLLDNRQLIGRVWDPRRGTEYLLREVIFPALEQSFEDLAEAAGSADLLVTHTAGYAGPIVAEKFGKRWISAALQPMVFFSAEDPPVLAPAPWLRHLYPLARWPFRLARGFAHRRVQSWIEPILRLRRRLGLPVGANPIFEGQFSPRRTLALFSGRFAEPQTDWPSNVTVTGFVYYDQLGAGFDDDTQAASELAGFLRDGPAPVLFTLGSSAVMHPGSFFQESLAAVQDLGVRAILLVGRQRPDGLPGKLPDGVFMAGYAPYSTLMPGTALTVHQGGIGTTAQALLAGKPMLVVPWAHDQPDNAQRLKKLGVSRTLTRARYTAGSAAKEINALLKEREYARKASVIRSQLLTEDGVLTACDAIEKELD